MQCDAQQPQPPEFAHFSFYSFAAELSHKSISGFTAMCYINRLFTYLLIYLHKTVSAFSRLSHR